MDSILSPFLEARDADEADRALGRLLMERADPLVRRLLAGKFRRDLTPGAGGRDRESLDAQDTVSEVHATLVRELITLRATPARERRPIQNFPAFVSTVASRAWVDLLRSRYPARARLLNQLRYLLETRSAQTGLAAWDDAEGTRRCGFARWRDRATAPAREESRSAFLRDPLAFVRDAISAGELKTVPPARLLAVIFDRLGGPPLLEDLVEGLADLWELSDPPAPAPGAMEDLADSGPTPEEATRWREYLAWLWQAVAGLSARQRAAFLLHSNVTHEFEHAGIAGLPVLATALGIPAEEFSALWADLPLADDAIAARLGCGRQQVINLRRAARVLLARELGPFLGDFPAPRAFAAAISP